MPAAGKSVFRNGLGFFTDVISQRSPGRPPVAGEEIAAAEPDRLLGAGQIPLVDPNVPAIATFHIEERRRRGEDRTCGKQHVLALRKP
jgi:hypothetical protein